MARLTMARIEEHFATLPDPRRREGIYPLVNIVVIALCAVISGADDFVAIARWARMKRAWLAKFLDLSAGIPSHDRFNAIFQAIKPPEFEKCLLSWITALHEVSGGQVIAIDGKTLRRSFDTAGSKSAIHMVSAWATANHISLGQVVVDEKSNEITAIPKLLEILDISGCLVTIDAMGCQRESAGAVARLLHESGYQLEERVTRPHPDKVRRFERARPNQLWQTDLFTFVLKRQNRRLYLVGFMDDHSRFVVGYGVHASASTALVLEVLRAAIASYGPPEEILTDNGPQYVTWRGKSQFTRELEQQGIRQIVSRPKHPQTLGKVERFWGTLWRECLQRAVFLDLEDARRRIGLFIDHYNFQRPHQGLEGVTPADRFFHAAPTVLATLQERVAANSLELARQGLPRPPFYMTGQIAGQPFSVHAEGERVFLMRAGQPRQEVELVGPAQATPEEAALPEALCPQGAPESPEGIVDPPPGTAWSDSSPPLAGGNESAEEDTWRPQGEGGTS